MTDARTAILSRIRRANGGSMSLATAEAEWHKIPRDYVSHSERERKEVLQLLEDRLLDYDATVTRANFDELGDVLARVLKQAGVRRMGVAPGLLAGDLPEGFEYVVDSGLSVQELDRLDGVLSRCAVAIAETGTLVLQSDATQGRRALTLVPDTHVCVVNVSQVVATVPEAFAWLKSTATLPTTFVSGPSATADIEMTRVKGVHGPRFLHVILLDDGKSTAPYQVSEDEHFEVKQ